MITEPGFEFGVFRAEHDRAGDEGECGERITDGQAAAYAPGKHFAKVGEVNGVADVGADASGGEGFMLMAGEEFGESAELCDCEFVVGESIENYSGAK